MCELKWNFGVLATRLIFLNRVTKISNSVAREKNNVGGNMFFKVIFLFILFLLF